MRSFNPEYDEVQATKVFRLPPIRLEAAKDDKPKWQMVALEGIFDGYMGGERSFTFTRETFDKVVENLHASPSYQAGIDGVGIANVIPWDFSHTSEQRPTEGVIPMVGAPA